MGKFALSPLDICIIVLEILLVVAIGMWVARRGQKTAQGFFLAGGSMPWWIIGSAFVSTSVSSEQIVGTIGASYRYGLGIANWEWWCLPTYLLVMVFFIPIYLRNHIATVPELLTRRFGPACGYIYSYVMLFGYVFVFLATILYGGSITFSQLTGWPFPTVLIVTATLVGIYTIKGGLGSVMWTDAVQCVMLVAGGVVLYFVALGHIPGGWNTMAAAVPERFHLYHPPDDPHAPFLALIAGSLGVFLFYQSTNQVMIQRILAARTTWDGLMGIVFAGFINLIRPLVTCLLGLVVYHWIEVMGKAPSLLPDHQDRAFPFALQTFAPSGLRGIILAGFIAAVMSAVSALANTVGTIFSLDLYRRVIRPEADDRQLIRVGRIATATALGIACLIAPLVGRVGIFKYFQTGVTYMATPFISVIIMGIFWKRVNFPAAMVGLIGGLAIEILLVFGFWASGVELHWLYIGLIAELITILLIIVTTLLTKTPAPEGAQNLVWKPSLVGHYDQGRKRPWYQQVKFWFSIYAVMWLLIYWRFW